MRIGIGHPGNKNMVHSYVLSDFKKTDRDWVERTLDAVAEAMPIMVEGDDAGFMNKVALLNPPPKKPKPAKPKKDPATEEPAAETG